MQSAVILPALNEAATVGQVVRSLRALFCGRILVIDDGSTDGTAAVAMAAGAEVLSHPQNLGYGAALMTGFRECTEDGAQIIACMDADGQHDARFLPTLCKALMEDSSIGIALASRYHPLAARETPAPRETELWARFTSELFAAITGLRIADFFGGMYAVRAGFLSQAVLTEPGYEFPINLWFECARLGVRVTEIPGGLRYLDLSRDFKGQYSSKEARARRFIERFLFHLERCARAGREGWLDGLDQKVDGVLARACYAPLVAHLKPFRACLAEFAPTP